MLWVSYLFLAITHIVGAESFETCPNAELQRAHGVQKREPAQISPTVEYYSDLNACSGYSHSQNQYFNDWFNSIYEDTKQKTKCAVCKRSLQGLNELAKHEQSLALRAIHRLCRARRKQARFSFLNDLCHNVQQYNAKRPLVDHFSFLPDFINAISEMDTQGLDGEYLCYTIFAEACPKPVTPLINYSKYWPAKQSKWTGMENGNQIGNSLIPANDNNDNNNNNNQGKAGVYTGAGSNPTAQTFKVLHLSDVHLSLNYTEHAPVNCLGLMCCVPDSFQNPFEPYLEAPRFGHWRCDSPPQLLDSAVGESARQKYAFVLFTGDMVDHNPALITRKNTMLQEEYTLTRMKNYFPNTAVYPVLGNHDSFPYSQEPPPLSKFRSRTARNINHMQALLAKFNWVTGEGNKQIRFTHGGYTVEPVEGLKIISLNSNYWYKWNFYNYIDIADPDKSGTIKFLIKELADCERRGIKAWVQAHISPGGLSTEALPPQASFLTATLERYSDTIAGLFFGHTHCDEFTVMYANNAAQKREEDALHVFNIGPSITPFSDYNPGWRHYEVNSNTFEIMEQITTFADIEPGFNLSWEETADLNWRQLYSARETYQSVTNWPANQPLNAKFWHRVAKSFLGDFHHAQDFLKFSHRNSSRSPKCGEDDYKRKAELYCYSTSATPDQVIRCNLEFDVAIQSMFGIPRFPMPKPVRFIAQN